MNDRIIKDVTIRNLINDNDFGSAVKRLFDLQCDEWSDLKENYSLLTQVKTNTFHFNGFRIKTQFNPGRIKSTSAKTDPESVQKRACFLCEENLPGEQKGILLDELLVLLINPYPVFPLHLTISCAKHVKQEILPHLDLFIECSKKLSGNFSLLYNGPDCGASAPDHLHFQAGTKYFLPIDDDFHQLKNEYGQSLLRNDLIEVTSVDDALRKFISIETNDSRILFHTFTMIYKVLEDQFGSDSEPKMNIIANYEEDFGWRVIILLRSKHRPDIYFAAGKEKLLFSPAVVDVGGLCITPVKRDFNRLNERLIKNIFNEVFIDNKSFNEIKNKLGTLLGYDSFND